MKIVKKIGKFLGIFRTLLLIRLPKLRKDNWVMTRFLPDQTSKRNKAGAVLFQP